MVGLDLFDSPTAGIVGFVAGFAVKEFWFQLGGPGAGQNINDQNGKALIVFGKNSKGVPVILGYDNLYSLLVGLGLLLVDVDFAVGFMGGVLTSKLVELET